MNTFWRLTKLVIVMALLFTASGTAASAANPSITFPAASAPTGMAPVGLVPSFNPPPPNKALSTTGPRPPVGVALTASDDPHPNATTINVPPYLWRHGCGPTSAGMLLGYWDQHGFDALYTTDDAGIQGDEVNEAIASSLGEKNHYNDYSLPDDSYTELQNDCSTISDCTPHVDNSIADFMHTSRAFYGLKYGWSYVSEMGPTLVKYVQYVNTIRGSQYDATTADYLLYISGIDTLWTVFTQEIKAGRPVVFTVDIDGDGSTDHASTATGFDVDQTGQRWYRLNNTWDYNQDHWFPFQPMQPGNTWGVYGFTTFMITDYSSYGEQIYLPAISAPMPELKLSQVKLYDYPGGSYAGWSNGNGDNKANPGEFIVMDFRLDNPNNQDLNDLYLNLETTDPYINNVSAYDEYYMMRNYIYRIPARSARPYNFPFNFMVASGTPTGHVVKYTIHITDLNGGDWSFPGSFTVTGKDVTPPHIYWGIPQRGYYAAGSVVTIGGLILEAGGIAQASIHPHSPDGSNATTLALYDNGTNGDDKAGDRFYKRNWTPGVQSDFQIDFQLKDSLGNAATYIDRADFTSKPFKASHSILLVVDCLNDGFVPYYANALAANGYTYDLWDAYYRGEFNPTVLNSYLSGVVIYAVPFYGDLYKGDAGPAIRKGLVSYLDNGGQLFITGQDTGYYLHDSGDNFYRDYLHAKYIQDNPGMFTLKGVSGDPISGGLVIDLQGGTGAYNQYSPDEIDPISPAQPIFQFTPAGAAGSEAPETVPMFDPLRLPAADQEKILAQTAGGIPPQAIISSGTGGVRAQVGGYKVVYLSYGFEGISLDSTRNTLMKRIITWLKQP